MLRKDVRSMIVSLVIGNGNLMELKRVKKDGHTVMYGKLVIQQGVEYADYQSWKAKLISTLVDRDVYVHTKHSGRSIEIIASMKRFRSWRKFCYTNDKKDIGKSLRFINNPGFMISVWLMDKGSLVTSITKNGNKVVSLRFFCSNQSSNSMKTIKTWFSEIFGINSKVAVQKKGKLLVPFIKLNNSDSLVIWALVRKFVLQFKSMQIKFSDIEQVYQNQIAQRRAGTILPDDIVRSDMKILE